MKDTLKRQKLFFISLIGIVVVSLTMTATFAYQTLQVDEKEGSKSGMTINVGKLDVVFKKDNVINLKNMPLLPDYKTADYVEFTIDNANSTDDIGYSLDLTSLDYSESLSTSDFRYTLVKVNSDNSTSLLTTGDFSSLSSSSFRIIFSSGNYRDLAKGDSEKVRLYLWLKETSNNQNYLENTYFKGVITISSLFKSEVVENTLLSGIIYRNARNNVDSSKTTYYENSITVPGDSVSNENERALLNTSDDLGVSYYYRGNVLDNYVNFAGMCFRIVRIEGDGSIKLILDDKNVLCNDANYTGDWTYTSVPFGYEESENSYKVNYLNSSNVGMANKLLEFQNTYMSSVSNKLRSGYWCYDDTAYQDEVGNISISKNDINNYYNTLKEFFYGSGVRSNNPSMKCRGENLYKFNNGTNMYVGALTLDEIIYAGLNIGNFSTSYLIDQYQVNNQYAYKTLSLNNFKKSSVDEKYYDYYFAVNYDGNVDSYSVNDENVFIRPVIVLDKYTFVNSEVSGNGTKDSPYVIS